MKMESQALLENLSVRTESVMVAAKKYKSLSTEELTWRPGPEKWNVLECLEHLSLYSDFYLPAIEKSISSTKHTAPGKLFKSGWFGNYFAESMPPREKLNTMKTFKSKNPLGRTLDTSKIDRFLEHQRHTLDLLKKAERVDISKVKCPTTIGNWMKINLGDTFRVVIYHNERHIVQAENVLATIK